MLNRYLTDGKSVAFLIIGFFVFIGKLATETEKYYKEASIGLFAVLHPIGERWISLPHSIGFSKTCHSVMLKVGVWQEPLL